MVMYQDNSQAEMNKLLTPEGIRELESKMEPLKMTQGVLPFESTAALDQVDQRPVSDRQATVVSSWSVSSGSRLFTLAPVYFVAKVPFDLVSQFCASEHGKGAQVGRLDFQKPVTPDIPGWENIVECVNQEHWDRLVLFLGECAFQRGGQIWTICGDTVNLPMAGVGTLPLAVFTPRLLCVRMTPYLQGGVIRFLKEEVAEQATASDYVRRLSNLQGGSK
jgi:hypothetical protein